MRADIHNGSEHDELQSEAGYIDARPLTVISTKPLATHGRTIHLGHSLPKRLVSASHDVRSTPKADIRFQPNICRDGPAADIVTRSPRRPEFASNWGL